MQTQEFKGVATNIRTEGEPGSRLTVCRYHSTDVVSFNDHFVYLNTGGWRTKTTKVRMNQAACQFGLGFRVFQDGGEWYIEPTDDTKRKYRLEGRTFTFNRRTGAGQNTHE